MNNQTKKILTVEYAFSDGCIAAKVKEYPGCLTESDDFEELARDLYEALSSHIGQNVPYGSIVWIYKEVEE